MKKKGLLLRIEWLEKEVSRLQEDLMAIRQDFYYQCANQPTIIPMMYPPSLFDQCPAGGQHDYQFPWYGIIPPPCRKCGLQGQKLEITCSNTTATSGEEYDPTVTYAKPLSTLTSQDIRIDANVKSNPDHDLTTVELCHPTVRRKGVSSKRRT